MGSTQGGGGVQLKWNFPLALWSLAEELGSVKCLETMYFYGRYINNRQIENWNWIQRREIR